MADIIEIRWHGRGGQGVKTAALLLADIAFFTGSYVQGFPEYGPERMGAPVTAYNRISSEPIRLHSGIDEPDYSVVVDGTMLDVADVTGGLKPGGVLLVNTGRRAGEVTRLLQGYAGRVCAVDANRISESCLGKPFPNMPMLAAAVKISGVMGKEAFLGNMLRSFEHKFSAKPEVIQGNMKALEIAYEEAGIA